MKTKIAGLIVSLVFVSVSWYIYVLYSYIPNLIFAISISVIFLVSMIISHIKKEEQFDGEGIDNVRNIFTVIAMLLFFLFFALNIKYGGSAASNSEAMSLHEGYLEGRYYLTSHGNFTEVSHDIWLRLRVVELLTMPLFLLMFFWNFIHIGKTKGFKYLLTGRNKDIKNKDEKLS